MPYKNKIMLKQYQKDWEERNKENRQWSNTLWRENNNERKNELDRKSWARHKEYYNCLGRLKRKLKNISDDLIYIKVTRRGIRDGI